MEITEKIWLVDFAWVSACVKLVFICLLKIPRYSKLRFSYVILKITFSKNQNSQLKVLFLSTRFGVGKKSMEERVQEEVHYLNQIIQKKEGEPFDIQVKTAFIKNKVLKFTRFQN